MAWTRTKTVIGIGIVAILTTATTTVVVEKHIQTQQFTPAPAPWKDAGASTPKAALQSLAWALSQGKTDRAWELMQWDEKGTDANPALMRQVALSALGANLDAIQSFRILSIKPTQQPGEVMVKIEETYKNRSVVPFAVTAKLRRVGSQWRVVAKIEYFGNGGTSMLLPFTGSF